MLLFFIVPVPLDGLCTQISQIKHIFSRILQAQVHLQYYEHLAASALYNEN